jgi:peptidoglycan hydrolase-like protein with peptidoglycan-binding domain
MTVEDGIFDDQTRDAVRAFRASAGMKPGGRVTERVNARLQAEAHAFARIVWPSDCAEMDHYRQWAGLPAAFQGIGWRESNCRNEDGVRTFCCYGWWQLYPSLHIRDHRMAPKMRACGVRGYYDIDSDTPTDKRRQACYAKALYDTVGSSAWAATR